MFFIIVSTGQMYSITKLGQNYSIQLSTASVMPHYLTYLLCNFKELK